MLLTVEIFRRARNHGKKFLKLCQISFSGIVHCRCVRIYWSEDHMFSNISEIRCSDLFFNSFFCISLKLSNILRLQWVISHSTGFDVICYMSRRHFKKTYYLFLSFSQNFCISRKCQFEYYTTNIRPGFWKVWFIDTLSSTDTTVHYHFKLRFGCPKIQYFTVINRWVDLHSGEGLWIEYQSP